jgi:hypothetical protein
MFGENMPCMFDQYPADPRHEFGQHREFDQRHESEQYHELDQYHEFDQHSDLTSIPVGR